MMGYVGLNTSGGRLGEGGFHPTNFEQNIKFFKEMKLNTNNTNFSRYIP